MRRFHEGLSHLLSLSAKHQEAEEPTDAKRTAHQADRMEQHHATGCFCPVSGVLPQCFKTFFPGIEGAAQMRARAGEYAVSSMGCHLAYVMVVDAFTQILHRGLGV